MNTKKKPERRCLSCNEKKQKNELLRIVRTPEKTMELDLTGKKNGRGAYICKSEDCLNRLIKSKKLEKSFEIEINQDFYNEIRGVIIDK